jgi:squalene cyclase
MVYLPMGYLYARKAVGKITPLVLQLREELYEGMNYNNINWSNMGNCVAQVDLYTPHSWFVNTVHCMSPSFFSILIK